MGGDNGWAPDAKNDESGGEAGGQRLAGGNTAMAWQGPLPVMGIRTMHVVKDRPETLVNDELKPLQGQLSQLHQVDVVVGPKYVVLQIIGRVRTALVDRQERGICTFRNWKMALRSSQLSCVRKR
jgi:hypothetical protein